MRNSKSQRYFSERKAKSPPSQRFRISTMLPKRLLPTPIHQNRMTYIRYKKNQFERNLAKSQANMKVQ